jgi:hypothetical protein
VNPHGDPLSPRCGVDAGRWSCGRVTAFGLCERCAGGAGGWLAELGTLLPQLPAALVPGSSGEGPRVSGSRDAPIPVRLAVLSLLGPAAGWDRRFDAATGLDPGDDRSGVMQHGAEPVLSVLLGWSRHVAEERHLTLPTEGTLYSMGRLLALRTFLARHHDWATRQWWADEYAADVHALWRTCRTVLGAWPSKPEHCDGVSCPRCDAMALYRLPGQDGRLCDQAAGGCGKWYDDDEWDRWCRLSAHFARVEGYRERDEPTRARLDGVYRGWLEAEGVTGHEAPCRWDCARCLHVVAFVVLAYEQREGAA